MTDFNAMLNEANARAPAPGSNAEPQQPNANQVRLPPGMSVEQYNSMNNDQKKQMHAAMQQRMQQMAMIEDLQKMDLKLPVMKGKLDIKWYGHAGFKIIFKDAEDIQRSIYIDMWIDNKDCPDADRAEPPNDTDLALVTHGQIDASMHAPFLMMAGKHEHRRIVSSEQVGFYMGTMKQVPKEFFSPLAVGGSKDFGWVKIHCVAAEHPSTWTGPQNIQLPCGQACGFVIEIPNHDIRIYHAGDTNVFSDMKLINDIYKPDLAMLPIGDCLGMGPREAVYAINKFLPNIKTVIPMHFGSFPVLTGTPEEFEKLLKESNSEVKMIHPSKFFGGAAFIEK